MLIRTCIIFMLSFYISLCVHPSALADVPFSPDHFEVYDDFESQAVHPINWSTHKGTAKIINGNLVGNPNSDGEFQIQSAKISRGWGFTVSRA